MILQIGSFMANKPLSNDPSGERQNIFSGMNPYLVIFIKVYIVLFCVFLVMVMSLLRQYFFLPVINEATITTTISSITGG